MIQFETKYPYTAHLFSGRPYPIERGERLTYRREIVTGDGVRALLMEDCNGSDFYVPPGLFVADGPAEYSVPIRLMEGSEHRQLMQDAMALLIIIGLNRRFWDAYPQKPKNWNEESEALHPNRLYELGYATRGLFGQPSEVTTLGDFFLSYAAKLTMNGKPMEDAKAYLAGTYFPVPQTLLLREGKEQRAGGRKGKLNALSVAHRG